MKKVIVTMIVLAFGIGIIQNAQAQVYLGAQAGAKVPMGDWADYYDVGIGGMLEGNYMLQDLAIGVNVGYYVFSAGDYMEDGVELDDGPNFSIIPIEAKGDYYFSDVSFMPYVGLGLGMYISQYEDYTYDHPLLGETTIEGESDSNFGVNPHVGFIYGNLVGFGAEVGYTIIEDANHLTANLRIIFKVSE